MSTDLAHWADLNTGIAPIEAKKIKILASPPESELALASAK